MMAGGWYCQGMRWIWINKKECKNISNLLRIAMFAVFYQKWRWWNTQKNRMWWVGMCEHEHGMRYSKWQCMNVDYFLLVLFVNSMHRHSCRWRQCWTLAVVKMTWFPAKLWQYAEFNWNETKNKIYPANRRAFGKLYAYNIYLVPGYKYISCNMVYQNNPIKRFQSLITRFRIKYVVLLNVKSCYLLMSTHT